MREARTMQAIQNGYRGMALVLALASDRILIPLAIVVGLVGGAMIGSEIARIQAPQHDFMR